MNREELKNKWWYRLIQVIYATGFITVAIFGIIPFATQTFPHKVFDNDSSYIKCTENNKTFFLAKNNIFINDGDLSLNDEVLNLNDDEKFKFNCATDTNQQLSKSLSLSDAENLIDSWNTNYKLISVYRWDKTEMLSYLEAVALSLLGFLFIAWLLRRIFFYVILKESFKKI